MNTSVLIKCDSTGEVATSYEDYIHTEHWKSIKKQAYEYWGKACVKCGRKTKLNMHHLTYFRIGHENIYMDVCPLCKNCHLKEHMAHPSSRRFLEHADQFLELGEVVKRKALARINEKWLQKERQAGIEMRQWLEAHKADILEIMKDAKYTKIEKDIMKKFGKARSSYIYKDAWFLEMLVRRGVSEGIIQKANKALIIRDIYQRAAKDMLAHNV